MPKNLGVDTFPDPVGHFGAHWHAVWRCGVAGGERVPPAPLGWYSEKFFLCDVKLNITKPNFSGDTIFLSSIYNIYISILDQNKLIAIFG